MNAQDAIHHFAARRNLTRPDVLRACRELGMLRQTLHYYWTGQRTPDPLSAAILCVALDLDAVECCAFYEACGIPTPDPVWQAVQDAARGFIRGEE